MITIHIHCNASNHLDVGRDSRVFDSKSSKSKIYIIFFVSPFVYLRFRLFKCLNIVVFLFLSKLCHTVTSVTLGWQNRRHKIKRFHNYPLVI